MTTTYNFPNGNVGIGTSSPTTRLQVTGASTDTNAANGTGVVRLVGAASGYSGYIGFDASTMSIGHANASRGLSFAAGGAERARITSAGNLLVGASSGTVSPAHHLIVSNNELNLAASTTSSTIYFNYRAGTTLTALRFMSGTGSTTYVACYGTSFTNSSDYRIKTDVQEVGSVLPKVAQLRPVNYIKEGVEGREFGLIAHEAQAVFPDMVSGEKDAVDEDGDMEIQGIDYAQLSTILVKAIQEQQAIIESLKARLDAANL